MATVEIVVLANSIKHRQRCVAGKCLLTGNWVRPVSDEDGGALSREQCRARNPHGSFCVQPMQKITVHYQRLVPLINQPDNYLIDGQEWTQNYKINPQQIPRFVEEPQSLWGEGDRVNYDDIENDRLEVGQSLYLVKVLNLRLYLSREDKRRASFLYGGLTYDLAVTDPKFDDIINSGLAIQDILCVSLGEPFQGSCYKIVASIF